MKEEKKPIKIYLKKEDIKDAILVYRFGKLDSDIEHYDYYNDMLTYDIAIHKRVKFAFEVVMQYVLDYKEWHSTDELPELDKDIMLSCNDGHGHQFLYSGKLRDMNEGGRGVFFYVDKCYDDIHSDYVNAWRYI